MKYCDLIQGNIPNSSEETQNFNIERYSNIPSHYFIHFKRNTLSFTQRKALHNTWKARISIHPDDLGKAWDIIYPTLIRSVDSFKVVDMNRLSAVKALHNEKKDQLLCTDPNFLNGEITLLRDAGCKLFRQLNSTKNNTLFQIVYYYTMAIATYLILYLAPKSDVSSYVASQHEKLMHQYNTKSTHLQRFSDGMSVTIYIAPSREDLSFKMLKTIERLLLLDNIRPGVIYPTDRALGRYTSVRHPGRSVYQDAVLVSSYNPDNVPDSFPSIQFSREFILQPNQIKRSASYNSFFNHNQADLSEKEYNAAAFSI